MKEEKKPCDSKLLIFSVEWNISIKIKFCCKLYNSVGTHEYLKTRKLKT